MTSSVQEGLEIMAGLAPLGAGGQEELLPRGAPLGPSAITAPSTQLLPNWGVMGIPNVGPGCPKWGDWVFRPSCIPRASQVSSVGPGAVQPLSRAHAHPPQRLFLQSPQELDEARSFLESSASFQPRGKRCCRARAKSSHEEPPTQAGGGPREQMDRRTDTQIRLFPVPAAVGLVGDIIWGDIAGGETQLVWDTAAQATIPL